MKGLIWILMCVCVCARGVVSARTANVAAVKLKCPEVLVELLAHNPVLAQQQQLYEA